MKFHPAHLSIASIYQKFIVLALLLLNVCSEVFAIDCSRKIRGLVNETRTPNVIMSPGFPQSYPKRSTAYRCTYELSILGDGFITLSFEDFHLHDEKVFTCKNNGTYDYLTINLHNNQSPNYYCGVGRPPTIITPKNIVTVELVVHAGSPDSFRGFRMAYKFISEEKKMELSENYLQENTLIPSYENDEGSFVEEVGQLLPGYTSQSVDYIWYVTAPEEEDRIQLTVKEFRYTPYTAAPMVLIADGPTSQSTSLQHGANVNGEPLFSSQRYMFVQLKGTVGAGTYFEVEFSFFRDTVDATGMCPADYFYCQTTTHCIQNALVCNGRNNCGQGEDERRCNAMSTFQPSCGGACFNGGVCVHGDCLCPENYFGTRCEFPIGNNNTNLEHTSIMIGAFVGAVCLLSICWLVAMARKRYTDGDQPPTSRAPQRMISIHSPEELGLRRSTTVGPGDLEIPPDYSEVFIEDNKPNMTARPSIISSNEPMSPPPSYDLFANDEELGIVIECPPAEEHFNLPDVVGQNESNAGDVSPVTSNVDGENVSRQTSRSTDV